MTDQERGGASFTVANASFGPPRTGERVRAEQIGFSPATPSSGTVPRTSDAQDGCILSQVSCMLAGPGKHPGGSVC